MKNELHILLRSRRSVRRFLPDPVPGDMIERILETAIYAPSAHNLQLWRFVVLTGPDAKSRLAETITGKLRQDMVADGIPEAEIQTCIARTIRRTRKAPVIIVLCRERTMVRLQPDAVCKHVESLMGVQPAALAGLQLILAAEVEGLGSTWVCWPVFAPDETCTALELPPDWEPQGMVFLGYSAESHEMPARLPLEAVTRYL